VPSRQRENPFDSPSIVKGYEEWYCTVGLRADRLEKDLLARLLGRLPKTRRVLEVGCGTGHFSRWFDSLGFEVVGVDLSMEMLQDAIKRGSQLLVQADALTLPFPERSFELVIAVTTLEFVSEPLIMLKEMLRVASIGILLGVINRQSLLGKHLRDEGGAIWKEARFYKPSELDEMIRLAGGKIKLKINWQTTLWPIWPWALPLPWGGFIGVAVEMP
jgi:ubiquinone/menaquinone biosynthesis C-methylase UbiE